MVWCQGKEPERIDICGFFKKNGKDCGEPLLQKEGRIEGDMSEWSQEHTSGLHFV